MSSGSVLTFTIKSYRFKRRPRRFIRAVVHFTVQTGSSYYYYIRYLYNTHDQSVIIILLWIVCKWTDDDNRS